MDSKKSKSKSKIQSKAIGGNYNSSASANPAWQLDRHKFKPLIAD